MNNWDATGCRACCHGGFRDRSSTGLSRLLQSCPVQGGVALPPQLQLYVVGQPAGKQPGLARGRWGIMERFGQPAASFFAVSP